MTERVDRFHARPDELPTMHSAKGRWHIEIPANCFARDLDLDIKPTAQACQ